MPKSEDIRQTIARLAADQKLLSSLQSAKTTAEKKKIASAAGLAIFSKSDVQKEIRSILSEGGRTTSVGKINKVDEPPNHVAAVAAAAAAAAAP